MFRIVCERLRVVAAFSEGRGGGCVWSASKDLKFFSTRAESEREESLPHRSEESLLHSRICSSTQIKE